jgi:hypothetical protein
MTEFQLTTRLDMLHREVAVDMTQQIPDTQTMPVSPLRNDEFRDEQELFTKDKLEETFNNDYYKLCYNNNANSSLNLTTTNVTKYIDAAQKMLMVAKENENEFDMRNEACEKLKKSTDQDDVSTARETTQILGERTNNQSKLLPKKLTSLAQDFNNMNNTYNSSIIYDSITTSNDSDTTMTGSNMNETIMYTIREPFNYEFKNRLLNRGPLEQLKKNPNFSTLAVNLPEIKVKTFLPLKNVNYNILEEIGSGAFAKIYLIETKDKSKYALKVRSLIFIYSPMLLVYFKNILSIFSRLIDSQPRGSFTSRRAFISA